MGGKSTFLRTVGINILLAHIGCYVCASEADISKNIILNIKYNKNIYQ